MHIVTVRITPEDNAKLDRISQEIDETGQTEHLLNEDRDKRTKGPLGYNGRKATTRGLLIRRAIHLGLIQIEQDGIS